MAESERITDMKFLKKTEVCEILGISMSSLDRHVKSGLFPGPDTKIGGLRWKLSSVNKWIDNHGKTSH